MVKPTKGYRIAPIFQGHQGQPHVCGYVVTRLSTASNLDHALFVLPASHRRLFQIFGAPVPRKFLNTSMEVLLASSASPVPAATPTQS